MDTKKGLFLNLLLETSAFIALGHNASALFEQQYMGLKPTADSYINAPTDYRAATADYRHTKKQDRQKPLKKGTTYTY